MGQRIWDYTGDSDQEKCCICEKLLQVIAVSLLQLQFFSISVQQKRQYGMKPRVLSKESKRVELAQTPRLQINLYLNLDISCSTIYNILIVVVFPKLRKSYY